MPMYSTVTDDEIHRLTSILKERSAGTSLSVEEFSDQLALLLEDVPGLEGLTGKAITEIAERCWNHYQQL